MALPEWLHWDDQHHRLLFLGQPATLFWQQPSLASMMVPLYEELGETYFSLLVAYSASHHSESDYEVITRYDDESFISGLLHWGEKIATAGWGEITGAHFDDALPSAQLIIRNPWEHQLFPDMKEEHALPFLCGKLSGIFSLHLQRNMRAQVSQLEILGDECIARIQIIPCNTSLQAELQTLTQQEGFTRLEKLQFLNQQLTQKNIELEASNRRLSELATMDALTCMANRRYFMELAEREFNVCRRYRYTSSMLMLDIDFFKEINDKYGHLAGDVVLKGIAQVCKELLRKTDFCGRFGGEEFLIMLPHTDLDGACIIGQRLGLRISQLVVPYENHRLQVTISMGVSAYKETDQVLDSWIKRVDDALYDAKHQGRNQLICRS